VNQASRRDSGGGRDGVQGGPLRDAGGFDIDRSSTDSSSAVESFSQRGRNY
jgi:hypothetical protein